MPTQARKPMASARRSSAAIISAPPAANLKT
jgi:hypothetical protein